MAHRPAGTHDEQDEDLGRMIPLSFMNYFLGSTGASAALIGLLFVAVSVAPDHVFGRDAPTEQRARAVSAFFALLDVFFVSLTALIPGTNLGYPALAMAVGCLITTLSLARHFWTDRQAGAVWQHHGLLVGALVIYGWQIWYAVRLLHAPGGKGAVFGISYLLLGAYSLGVARAWQLLGAPHEGLLTLLGLRREPAGPAPTTEEPDDDGPADEHPAHR